MVRYSFLIIAVILLSCKEEAPKTACDCVSEVVDFMIKDRESGYQLKEDEYDWSDYCEKYTDSMNNLNQDEQKLALEEWKTCPDYDAYDHEFELLIEHLKEELESDLGPMDEFEQGLEGLVKEE